MKKYRIAQIGTFDVENYGDLLFPVILENVFSSFAKIDLYSPNGGIMPFTKDKSVYSLKDLPKNCKEKKYDAIIIGGGDLIRLDKGIANIYPTNIKTALSIWQWPILIASAYNIPIFFNCPGVPHKFEKYEKDNVKEILKFVDYLSVRDETSKQILIDAGLKNIEVVPDSILLLNKIYKEKELEQVKNNLIKNKKIPQLPNEYLIFQHNTFRINDKNYLNKLKEFLKRVQKENNNIVFLPIGYVHNDLDFLRTLQQEIGGIIVEEKLSPLEIASILSSSDGYIGTSMHGLVTSYVYKKPILALNTQKLTKIKGLLKVLEREEINIEEIEDIEEKYDNYFENYDYSILENQQQKIYNHFNKIKGIIKENPSKRNDASLCMLNQLYKENDKLSYNLEWKMYLDYGNGFSEENTIVLNTEKINNDFKLKTKIPQDIQAIRIDPTEGLYVNIENLQIKINNKEHEFKTIDTIKYKNQYLFCTKDPQIYLENNISNKEIEINGKFKIMQEDEVIRIQKEYFQDHIKK